MKRLLVTVALVAAIASSVFGTVIKDSLGREVDVKTTKRVAALNSSLTDLWQTSGGKVSITVGESVNMGYVPANTLLVDGSSGMSINSELLVAYRPDLVLLSGTLSSHLKLQNLLEGLNIPALFITVEDFDEYKSILKELTTLNNSPEAYEKYVEEAEKEIDSLVQRAKSIEEKPSVLFLRAGSGFSSTKARASEDHFAAAIIKDLGGINIADGTVLSSNLSLEAIVEKDPDMILIITQGNDQVSSDYVESLFQTPGWKDLSAIKENRYYFLERRLFHFKPFRYWNESYREMFKILYSEEAL